MGIVFENLGEMHQGEVMEILNGYITGGTAAFPREPLPAPFFEMLRKKSEGLSAYALRDTEGNRVVGFCSLNPYSPFSTFRETATLSYFIDSAYTGKGLGTQCLQKLEADAARLGICHLIAEISEENQGSVRFHEQHGFRQVGALQGIGEKLGRRFSVVHLQKTLPAQP